MSGGANSSSAKRDRQIVLHILGEVDSGHAAFPEAIFDPVAVGEGRGEASDDLDHGRLR